VNCCLSEIRHQANKSCIPFICNLSEGGTATCHENLPDSIFKLFEAFIIYFNECLSSYFFGVFILESPSTIFLGEFFLDGSDFGEDAHFKSIHVE
jgi:hypothetical protein